MSDEFDIELGGDIELGADFGLPRAETRYVKPPANREIPEQFLKYSDAAKLARDLKIQPGERAFIIVNGSFYFGDFIEAWLVENGIHAREMTISTLSLNENNVDSLANLLDGGWVDRLNLIVSGYMIRIHKDEEKILEYLYKRLDKGDRFQLAMAGSHCKTALIETYSGHFITMHGSANLRSSSEIEQLMVEEGKALYDFVYGYQSAILADYATIRHKRRGEDLWELVTRETADEAEKRQEVENQARQRPEHYFQVKKPQLQNPGSTTSEQARTRFSEDE